MTSVNSGAEARFSLDSCAFDSYAALKGRSFKLGGGVSLA